jgi:hypothetical protein
MIQLADVKEVERLMENISWLKTQMPKAVSNWKDYVKSCAFYRGILKEICENPSALLPSIFDPLIKWLADYILLREGRLAFTGKALDDFLKVGLRRIYNFIYVMDIFIKNPKYFFPDPSSQDLSAFRQAQVKQNQYKQFLILLNQKLIGCNDQLNFLFLKLSKTIKVLPQDLINIQKYLEQECTNLRIRNLELRR